MSVRKHTVEEAGHLLDVLRVAVAAVPQVGKVATGLPAEGSEPLGLSPRHLLAVGLAVFLVHQLVERLLHGILPVGKGIGGVEALHKRVL